MGWRAGARVLSGVAWGLFCLWLLAQLPFFIRLAERGRSPIDFLTYRRAADALARGESPYATPERGLEVCREFHAMETELLAAAARGQGPEAARELEAGPQRPGLYIYPPTLALLIAQLDVSAPAFTALIMLSILGFAGAWLAGARAGPVWLGLIMLSWDVLASWYGGNVELVLLLTALLAAELLWAGRAPLAAPLIALAILIKPTYGLFFVAFGLLMLVRRPGEAVPVLRSLVIAAGLSLVVVAVEVFRWGPELRTEALRYTLRAADYMCFGLPPAEQTPLSAWNRTPLQALVSAGVPYPAAQPAALGLWMLFVAVTLWRARGTALSFAQAFALALVLLYWGRPVGWGLVYLEVVLLAATWPSLRGWEKPALLGAALALIGSHWWALALTLRGEGMPLLTLQPADLPWETWLVLPVSWLLLLRALPPPGAPHSGSDRSAHRDESHGL